MGIREETHPLYGDILEAILSHVPPLYLLPASQVSKSWQQYIISFFSFHPHMSKPWLIIHVQSPRNHSIVSTHAYDPNSHVWIDVTHAAKTTPFMSCIQSSNSNLLYTLVSPSKLAISFDALNDTWQCVDGGRVWRNDPIVALVGHHVVVAGGVYDFEDDRMAVETYDMESRRWDTSQPLPGVFKESASATWLSVAVSDEKMFLLEKKSSKLCTFDPRENSWEGAFDLRPSPLVYFSTIALLSSDRLILIGLLGDDGDVQNLMLWEVNCETFKCKEIAKMPFDMLKRLRNADSSISSVNIAMVQDFIYIYNPSNPREIVYCDFSNCMCQWGSVKNLIVNDRNWMHKFIITSSKVGFNYLQKASSAGNRKFIVKSSKSC